MTTPSLPTLPKIGSLWSFQGQLYTVSGVDERYVHLDGFTEEEPSVRVPVKRWPSGYQIAWPPAKDSRWRWVPEGEQATPKDAFTVYVRRVEGNTIHYFDVDVGKMGSATKQEWFSEFRPLYDPLEERVYVALLLGGAEGEHRIRLKEDAAQIDVDIRFHIVVGTSVPRGYKLPKDVEVVLVLPRFTSRDNMEIVKDAARYAGVPFLVVESQAFLPKLWEKMRDVDPERYRTEWFGSQTPELHTPPSEETWVWNGDDWDLQSDRPSTMPAGSSPGDVPPPRSVSGDSTAAGVLTAAALIALWGASHS